MQKLSAGRHWLRLKQMEPVMTERVVKTPGPDHPISIEKAGRTWRAVHNGQVIAESDNVLVMRETSYPPVAYFPRADVKMDLLQGTNHHTYCPYKGEANYFSINAGNSEVENAVWSYEAPYEAVESIRERLAFYATKIDSVSEV
jgi:uncharacterized protein (DUF427 family)